MNKRIRENFTKFNIHGRIKNKYVFTNNSWSIKMNEKPGVKTMLATTEKQTLKVILRKIKYT